MAQSTEPSKSTDEKSSESKNDTQDIKDSLPEQSSHAIDAPARKKAKLSAAVIIAWILIFIVVICLVIAVFYAYVEPKEAVAPLFKSLM